ncbi:hypothetical protein NDU88_002549 [Pleurodeles waltl]|uniref:Myb-like domain-containing protein n=1 Tax=Pleurodeles waltl TaxID=8319 RepID=A0AAV7VAU4_PLEWA|nr:hypothetical protein NDU88_002549 [Pleurodeles waltl]
MVRTATDVTAIFFLFTHLLPDLQQERTYTAAVTCVWKRQWLMCLGKGPCLHCGGVGETGGWGPTTVPFTLWSSRPTGEYNVSAHQKKGIWRAIAKEVWTLGVFDRWSTHCRKRWEDLHCWVRKMAKAQLGLASQRGRGACCILTPPMFHILAVAYPELDGRLRASQQPQEGEYKF